MESEIEVELALPKKRTIVIIINWLFYIWDYR